MFKNRKEIINESLLILGKLLETPLVSQDVIAAINKKIEKLLEEL